MLQHLWAFDIVQCKKYRFSSNAFFHLKLGLMSNVNIPKDAARSGLSRYILIIEKTSNYSSLK
jgi:hypothetical protein